MPKLIILLLILVGLAVGVYLVQQHTNLLPKAAEEKFPTTAASSCGNFNQNWVNPKYPDLYLQGFMDHWQQKNYPKYDLNHDGIVNVNDLVAFVQGGSCRQVIPSCPQGQRWVISDPSRRNLKLEGFQNAWNTKEGDPNYNNVYDIASEMQLDLGPHIDHKVNIYDLVTFASYGSCQVPKLADCALADFNNDKKISILDLTVLGSQFNKPVTDANKKFDLDNDGKINQDDVDLLKSCWGQTMCVGRGCN